MVKKKVVEQEPEAPVEAVEPTVQLPEDPVKVTVLKGSVFTFTGEHYAMGETFTTTRAEAEKIDPSFVKIEPA